MNTREMTDAFFDKSIRIEKMIWLPALGHEPPEVFTEFCDDYEPRCFTGDLPPGFKGPLEDDDLERNERAGIIAETVTGDATPGFLVEIGTPVREWRSNDSYTYSWGHYNTTWLYAETLDDLTKKAVAWADERIAASKKKTPKKQSLGA